VKVFVSYRRSDVPAIAEEAALYLKNEFFNTNVFLDVHEPLAGTVFSKILEREIDHCDVFLAIIGPNWLIDKEGRNRATESVDVVRDEIHYANNKSPRHPLIFPVLVGNVDKDAIAVAGLPYSLLVTDRSFVELPMHPTENDYLRLIEAVRGDTGHVVVNPFRLRLWFEKEDQPRFRVPGTSGTVADRKRFCRVVSSLSSSILNVAESADEELVYLHESYTDFELFRDFAVFPSYMASHYESYPAWLTSLGHALDLVASRRIVLNKALSVTDIRAFQQSILAFHDDFVSFFRKGWIEPDYPRIEVSELNWHVDALPVYGNSTYSGKWVFAKSTDHPLAGQVLLDDGFIPNGWRWKQDTLRVVVDIPGLGVGTGWIEDYQTLSVHDPIRIGFPVEGKISRVEVIKLYCRR
jgi:hypothetical protein